MLKLISRLFGKSCMRQARLSRARPARRLCLEFLEDRCVPSTLLVDPELAPKPGIFATISGAVAAAHNGDTINVVPGLYHEGVDITKSLVLNGSFHVTDGPLGSAIILANPASTGFAFDANNITVENFKISGEADAIRTNAAFSGFHILNNVFSDDQFGVHLNTSLATTAAATIISGNTFSFDNTGVAPQDDVLIDNGGARNVVISNNSFHASESDASVKFDATKQSTNVQIINNRFKAAGSIVLDNVTKATVAGNIITNPTGTAVLLDADVTQAAVTNNSLSASASPAPDGIVVNGSKLIGAFFLITDSGINISNNSLLAFGAGISVSFAHNNVISGNDIADSQDDGIVLGLHATSNTVSANTVFKSSLNGIHLTTGTNAISGNTVEENTQDGIFLDGASGNTVTKNAVSHNGTNGIALGNASANMVSGNIVNDNGPGENGVGISLNGGTGNTLSANTANSNGSGGISLNNSSANTLSGNTVDFTQNVAFEVAGATSALNTLTNNTALFDNIGFSLDGAINNTLSKNIASHNFQVGFQLGSGANKNTLSGNTANGNVSTGGGGGGFFDLGQGSPTDVGNTYTQNVARNNGGNGFLIEAGVSTLLNNVATGNLMDGFDLLDPSDSMIKGNTADNNQFGFFLESLSGGGAGNVLSGNIADSNTRDGFSLADISANMVSGNTANGNGGNGLLLTAAADCMVSGNTADNNSGAGNPATNAGINVDSGSSGNTISGNTALGNGAAVGGSDLRDGSGTTTHNTWSNNKAVIRNPLGLG
jgi:parallel beta-helix repeat protein